MENIITKNVDYNCNLGQFFDAEGNDSEMQLLEYMSSINITCGIHAGSPLTIKKVLEHCRHKNKVIGAQIGFPVNQEKPYNPLELGEDEIEALVLYQVSALAAFAKSYGLAIEHVRPCGDMYKLASEDLKFSLSVAKAVKKFSSWLIYYGAAGAVLKNVAEQLNINIANEVHLDKIYSDSGNIDYAAGEFVDTNKSVDRLKKLLTDSQIDTSGSGFTKIEFDTIHFSAKAPNAAETAKLAVSLKVPKPVNYNKVEASGWV